MSDERADTATVIHRKAQVARDEFDAREMSPSKALRLALAKAADAQFDLALVVRMVEHVTLPLAGVEDAAGENGLLILLDGDEGPPGAIKLDLQFVMALIEAQLMGEVRPGEAAERPFTPTDAAIVQPLMNAVLDSYSAQMKACATMPDAPLYRFGDRVEDGRTLALALSAPDYDLYRLTVDFGPGRKTGMMEIILPQRPPAPLETDLSGDDALAAKLEENAMNAPVMLDAVLAPLHLPLDEVCRWAPGTVLPLAPEVIGNARVVGAKGHVIARAKLGQLNGFRAVRMMARHDDGQDEMPEAGRSAPGVGHVRPPPMSADAPAGEARPELGNPGFGQEMDHAEVVPSVDDATASMTDADLDAMVEEELARATARFEAEDAGGDVEPDAGV